MRSMGIIWGLLAGLVFLGTGATSEGVQKARTWQHAGDIAVAHRQWDAAYGYYRRIAETFPGTPHGRYAAARASQVRRGLYRPARPSSTETPVNWLGEIVDFVTWP